MEESRMKALGGDASRRGEVPQAHCSAHRVRPRNHVDEAYRIQLRMMEVKKSYGQVVVGKKIGITSRAMQAMLGVNEPDYGHILDGMVVAEGETIRTADLIQPRIEGEIASF